MHLHPAVDTASPALRPGQCRLSCCRAKPWQLGVPVDMAIPCATENEVGLEDAQSLVEHGCKLVLEGG